MENLRLELCQNSWKFNILTKMWRSRLSGKRETYLMMNLFLLEKILGKLFSHVQILIKNSITIINWKTLRNEFLMKKFFFLDFQLTTSKWKIISFVVSIVVYIIFPTKYSWDSWKFSQTRCSKLIVFYVVAHKLGQKWRMQRTRSYTLGNFKDCWQAFKSILSIGNSKL